MDLAINKSKEKSEQIESTRGQIYFLPETDIFENNDSYKIIFDLPGIEKDEINLKIEKDVLTITAESKKEPVESYECIREEMEFTGYQRSFNLNGVVDTGKIDADYRNGTLTLTLPKRAEQKTKEIQIKVS
jgi:HSP20 family protein